MSLGSIVARVENELQYAPDLSAYRADIRQLVNARYLLLSKERDWPWLNRRAPLYVFPDLVIANADVSSPGGGVYGNRTLLMPDSVFTDITDVVGDWITRVRPMMCGAEWSLVQTPTFGGVSNWEDGPFVVELAESYPSSPPARTLVHLDPRATIPLLSGTEGSFQLCWRRYALPPDLDVLRCVYDEQGTPLTPIRPVVERRMAVQPDDVTGQRPGWFLEDFGHNSTYPAFLYPGLSDITPSNPDQTEHLYQRQNQTVRIPPTLAFSGAGGLWLASTTVRVFFSWFYAGRLGPPGPIAEATCDVNNRSLVVSGYNGVGLLPLSASVTAGGYGRRLAIFVSEDLYDVNGTGRSAFYFRGFVNPGNTTDTSLTIASPRDTGTASAGTIRTNGTLELPRFDRTFPGMYTYIRLYPRPATAARYELDYQARAMELVEDSDAPEFHHAFEEVLVYATCLEMAKRYARSADVTVWERFYAEWVSKLVGHYTPQLRYELQRGAIGQTVGTPVITASAIRYTP